MASKTPESKVFIIPFQLGNRSNSASSCCSSRKKILTQKTLNAFQDDFYKGEIISSKIQNSDFSTSIPFTIKIPFKSPTSKRFYKDSSPIRQSSPTRSNLVSNKYLDSYSQNQQQLHNCKNLTVQTNEDNFLESRINLLSAEFDSIFSPTRKIESNDNKFVNNQDTQIKGLVQNEIKEQPIVSDSQKKTKNSPEFLSFHIEKMKPSHYYDKPISPVSGVAKQIQFIHVPKGNPNRDQDEEKELCVKNSSETNICHCQSNNLVEAKGIPKDFVEISSENKKLKIGNEKSDLPFSNTVIRQQIQQPQQSTPEQLFNKYQNMPKDQQLVIPTQTIKIYYRNVKNPQNNNSQQGQFKNKNNYCIHNNLNRSNQAVNESSFNDSNLQNNRLNLNQTYDNVQAQNLKQIISSQKQNFANNMQMIRKHSEEMNNLLAQEQHHNSRFQQNDDQQVINTFQEGILLRNNYLKYENQTQLGEANEIFTYFTENKQSKKVAQGPIEANANSNSKQILLSCKNQQENKKQQQSENQFSFSRYQKQLSQSFDSQSSLMLAEDENWRSPIASKHITLHPSSGGYQCKQNNQFIEDNYMNNSSKSKQNEIQQSQLKKIKIVKNQNNFIKLRRKSKPIRNPTKIVTQTLQESDSKDITLENSKTFLQDMSKKASQNSLIPSPRYLNSQRRVSSALSESQRKRNHSFSGQQDTFSKSPDSKSQSSNNYQSIDYFKQQKMVQKHKISKINKNSNDEPNRRSYEQDSQSLYLTLQIKQLSNSNARSSFAINEQNNQVDNSLQDSKKKNSVRHFYREKSNNQMNSEKQRPQSSGVLNNKSSFSVFKGLYEGRSQPIKNTKGKQMGK